MAPTKHSSIWKSARNKNTKKLKAALAASKRWGQEQIASRPTITCDDSTPVPSTSNEPHNQSDQIGPIQTLGLPTIRVTDISVACTSRSSQASYDDNSSLSAMCKICPSMHLLILGVWNLLLRG